MGLLLLRSTKAPPQGGPVYTAGVWKDITPPVSSIGSTFGIPFIRVDPTNTLRIYACCDQRGVWRTEDGCSNWAKVGTETSYDFDGTTTWLDSPIRVEVNPNNANALIATQGVRGDTIGFWRSLDRGANWYIPSGFQSVAATLHTGDVTAMAVNPTDPNHVLVGFHSLWNNGSVDRTAGIIESFDRGETWTIHEAPAGANWPQGSFGLHFAYDPASGQGNSGTWLVFTDGVGAWRTTNSGTSWTQVSAINVPHGGNQIWYDKNGKIWTGGENYPMYSSNNGASWTQLTTGSQNYQHYCVVGDGSTLYTQLSYAGTGGLNGTGNSYPFQTTSEDSPGTWTNYQSGAQVFANGPYMMQFVPSQDILYAACWSAGLWALKVLR